MGNPVEKPSEYTVAEYARLKNLSTTEIYRRIENGTLRHKKIGKIKIILTNERFNPEAS